MGLFDFARNAGAKIGIGKSTDERKTEAAAAVAATKAAEHVKAVKEAKETAAAVKGAQDAFGRATAEKNAAEAGARAAAAKVAADAAALEASTEAGKSVELEAFISKMGLPVTNLDIRFDNGIAYISGDTPTQADLEKIVLAVGNVGEVDRVIEFMKVAELDAEESQIHTVVSGDTLSKIAKKYYDDASKYPVIFEANKPMLSDPDKIFPGQALRIPGL
jgi:nucleoid-associated protein YgaU